MSYDDYYDDDEDERGRSARLVGLVAIVLGVAALAWFVVVPRFQGDSVTSTQSPESTPTTDESASSEVTPPATDDTAETTTPSTDDPSEDQATDTVDTSSTGTAGSTTDSTSDSTAPATTSGEPAPSDTEPASSAATYPTLPDGSPVPVLAVFDTETVTLSGVVPDEEAAGRLEFLAIANSKFPDAEVVSALTFDPNVPANVGVRVIEMNSVRFPESTADLLAEHRSEIDRAGGILSLFPNVSVLVIGHADQRGDSDTNFAISEERARAVSTYLVSTGIDPSRVSSRAVGDLDLLALENDAQAFALNRRTEFVFYGLLADPE